MQIPLFLLRWSDHSSVQEVHPLLPISCTDQISTVGELKGLIALDTAVPEKDQTLYLCGHDDQLIIPDNLERGVLLQVVPISIEPTQPSAIGTSVSVSEIVSRGSHFDHAAGSDNLERGLQLLPTCDDAADSEPTILPVTLMFPDDEKVIHTILTVFPSVTIGDIRQYYENMYGAPVESLVFGEEVYPDTAKPVSIGLISEFNHELKVVFARAAAKGKADDFIIPSLKRKVQEEEDVGTQAKRLCTGLTLRVYVCIERKNQFLVRVSPGYTVKVLRDCLERKSMKTLKLPKFYIFALDGQMLHDLKTFEAQGVMDNSKIDLYSVDRFF